MKNKSIDSGVLFVCLFFFIAWVVLLSRKYYFFAYGDWDLDLYAQAMWNLSHGSTFTSLFGISFLANHANYIAFLLAPLYFFFQHPLTLVYLKLFSFFAGAFVFYKVARQKLPAAAALIFMVLYILHPPNIFMLLFEFDFESLSIGLLFLLFYFYRKENFPAFIGTAFLTAICKENLPLVIIMFGFYALFFKKERKFLWAGSAVGLGAAVFTVEMFILTPWARQSLPSADNIYLSGYVNVVQSPHLLQKLLSPENFNYLRDLFGPTIVPALLSPQILLLGLPLFIQSLMGPAYTQHTIFFHYAATVVPVIFMAVIRSLEWVYPRLRQRGRFLVIALFVVMSLGNIAVYKTPLEERTIGWQDRLDPIRSDFVQRVPADAAVVTTFDLLGHLSQRRYVYALYNVWIGTNHFTAQTPFLLPERVDHAVVDFSDAWMEGALRGDPRGAGARIGEVFLSKDWGVQEAVEDLVFFKKNSPQGFSLVDVQKEPFSESAGKGGFVIDGRLRLETFRIEKNTSVYSLVPITFFWNAVYETGDRYAMILAVLRDQRPVYIKGRNIGYGLYPTSIWKSGEYIQERYFYGPPPLRPGKYTLEMLFFNVTQNREAVVSFEREGQIQEGRSILIDFDIKG